MDAKAVDTITNLIYRQFPEMDGVKPKIRLQSDEPARTGVKGVSIHSSESFLLTYQCKVNTSNGKPLSRSVRVVATSEGKILKITTSR